MYIPLILLCEINGMNYNEILFNLRCEIINHYFIFINKKR